MGGTYNQFFAAVRQRESSNNYKEVNGPGYLGAYQMGEASLIDIGWVKASGARNDNVYTANQWTGQMGINSKQDFLNNPAAQDAAATLWFAKIWSYIRNFDLEAYNGQILNGVELTKSGMIGGAHLVGIGGLRTFIQSGGTVVPRDGNGTPITEYIKLFAGYDVPAAFVDNHEKPNTIEGGSKEDHLRGFGADDRLIGGGGNDHLRGGEGNDTLEGGAGIDTAYYAGKASDYSIVRDPKTGVVTITHLRNGATEGKDTLISVEKAVFADRTETLAVNSVTSQVDFALVVDTTGSMGSSISAVKAQLASLVGAIFQNGDLDARISVIGFKDPGEVSTLLSFTEQDQFADRTAAIQAAIGSISVGGGGDTPEGDNSALLHALMGNAGAFRDTAASRKIALFTDAPVKDTELAGLVSQYASGLGVSVASASTTATRFGTMTSVTFAEVNGTVPTPIQIYTILVGYDWSAEESVRAIAENNGGEFFRAFSGTDLTQALLQVIAADPNQVPDITSNGGEAAAELAVARDTVEVAQVTATDADGDLILYSIAGGDDAAAFTIDALTGSLTFVRDAAGAIIDDQDGDDRYQVVVSASDGTTFDLQELTVAVQDHAPSRVLIGGNGTDELLGGTGDDRLDGGNGQDSLLGRLGNDWLLGGNGSDTLDGGAGDDRLEGGQGADFLWGGEGADLFVFGRDDATDVVGDFFAGEDHILLTEGVIVTGRQVLDFDDDGQADLALDLDTGTRVILLGVPSDAQIDFGQALATPAATLAHSADSWLI